MYDKLLVLDLDECLVHSSERVRFPYPDYAVGPYLGVHRPYLKEFLQLMRDHFEVGIWTASGSEYAHEVIGTFSDPGDFSFVWCADRCTHGMLKDIRKLKRRGYRKEKIIAVDDRLAPWIRSHGNLVQVPRFEGSPEDDWLVQLAKFLDTLGYVPDVRRANLKGWWWPTS